MDGVWFVALFGGTLFASMGLLALSAIVPWWNWLEARNWNIVSATLTQTEGDLTYEYEWAGKRYLQTAFSIDDGEDDGGISPARYEFVRKHKPGDTVTAYLNPEDPAEAVLDRGLFSMRDTQAFWIGGVFAVALILPGLWGAVYGAIKIAGYIRDVARFKREAYS